MNLTSIKNYLDLLNPDTDKYKVDLAKYLNVSDEIQYCLSVRNFCTLIPREVRIFKNKDKELIMESENNELNIYFPWLTEIFNLKYYTFKHRSLYDIKVHKIFMKD